MQYALYLKDTTTGATTVYNPNISGTSFAPSTPLPVGHSYVWNVGAEGTLADAGPVSWSGPAAFSVAVPALAAPMPNGPSGTIFPSSGYDTPTFSWSSVPAAVSYNLYVQDAATKKVVIDNSTLTGTSFTPGPVLLAGHSYNWWVGSETAAGALGVISWSGMVSFTLSPLAPPTNLTTNFSGTTPTLSWSSVTGASFYRLYVVDAVSGAVVLDNSSLTVPSFTITGGLTSGHRYTWYVAALGAAARKAPTTGAARPVSLPGKGLAGAESIGFRVCPVSGSDRWS